MSTSAESMNTSMHRTIENSWDEIERITQAMKDAAAQKDWPHVVEGAAARHHTLLNHFDSYPVGPQNALFYRERLTQMLAGEQSLHALAVDARREIMRESATTNYSHRALSAYLT
jgi:thymidylate synthase ThyX